MQQRDEQEEDTENARAGSSTGPGAAGNPGLRRGGSFQRRRPYTVIDFGDFELVDLTGDIDDDDESGPSVGVWLAHEGLC